VSVRDNRIRLMSFASHYFSFLNRLRVPAVLLVLLLGGTLGYLYHRLPAQMPSSEGHKVSPPAWPSPPANIAIDWTRFRGASGGTSLGQPDFAKGFRFAGTFFLSDSEGREVRKAVLGIEAEGVQVIASEGDVVADVTVSRIFENRVLLQRGMEVAELWLSFASRASSGGNSASETEAATRGIERFGESVGDNSWVLRRESLLDYYNELLDEPERLLQVFDSLKPLYGGDGKIQGYHLGMEGEQEFFKTVGLREGDVIRKVNSLEMTNRNRAEFFIRQVVQNQLSAVVIDIERDGEAKRLVYRVR
jgi:type II secretory pathway component PulC